MLMDRLSMAGKAVIVTGAGRGLGKGMALALADAGADVVCAARTRDQIDETADEIRARGRRALSIVTDVTDAKQVDALVQQTLTQWGALHVLIASAGAAAATALKDLTDISDADWRATIDANLSAAFFTARAVVPHFRERGGGVIINVAANAGMRGDPRLLAYGAAKAGVVNLTRALASQLATDNVRVNCIVPGFVLTQTPHDAEEINVARNRGRFIPAARLGEPWEVGPLALYLASDASSYVTGETFVIDGGTLAGGLAPVGWDVTAAGAGAQP
ncbi:MAG: glucose 1-dehydrogenase [Dehalococcoidia bacterium]